MNASPITGKLICGALLAYSVGIGCLQADAVFVRGDANSDGSVDLSDAVIVLLDLFVSQRSEITCRDASTRCLRSRQAKRHRSVSRRDLSETPCVRFEKCFFGQCLGALSHAALASLAGL